jgi:O-antigen ligase
MKKVPKMASNKTNPIDERHSILFWLLMTFVILFLFIVPFNKGLFNGGSWQFEGPIYKAFLWSSIALLVMAVYVFRFSRQFGPRNWLSLIVWLIPLSYLISAVNAASLHSALNGVYVQIIYVIFFLMGLFLTRSKLGLTIVANTFVFSGYTIVIFGLMNWFGNAHFQEAILYGRLSNVFQYPNTYAAFLVALLFSGMVLASKSKTRYVMLLLHASMFVPIMLSFILTSSRGGMVVFPIIMAIYLSFLSNVKQIINIIYLIISGLVSLLVLTRITNISVQLREEFSSSLSVQGWLIIIALSLLVIAFVFVLQKYMEIWLVNKLKFVNRIRLARFFIPVALVIIVLIGAMTVLESTSIQNLLPHSIRDRIVNFSDQENSYISRSAFYKDSFGLIKDYPIFGAGGGAWSSLYQVYQSYHYTSRQAHNFIIQYLVETGVFGIVVLFGFLVYILITFFKNHILNKEVLTQEERIVFVMIASAILAHSLLDFDMSFVYLGALVFLSLGGMSAAPHHAKATDATSLQDVRWHKFAAFAMSVISIIIVIIAFRAVQGNLMYVAAANDSSRDYYQISGKLDKAIKYAPNHPTYVETKVALLSQAYTQTKQEQYYKEAQKLLANLASKEPYDQQVLNQQYVLYELKGEMGKGLETYLSKLKIMPWDISNYEKAASLLFDLGYQAKEKGFEDKGDDYWDKALEIYEDVIERRRQIDLMPSYPRAMNYNFRLTDQLALSIGQIYYMRKEYELAEKVFDTGRTSNNFTVEINRTTAYWQLATLRKQGKDNKLLYDLLMAYDQDSDKQIEMIMELIQ